MSPRVPRTSPSCCWKVLGLEPPGDNSEPGEAGRGLKEFWGWETSEGREWGWRGLGCTSMKGPDYRPELESDVWERARSRFLQLPPLSRASGLLWEGSRQMAKWRRKKEEWRVGICGLLHL